jgi:hypothetical protein
MEAGQLKPEDAELLAAALTPYLYVAQLIDQKSTSIARLLGGVVSDGRVEDRGDAVSHPFRVGPPRPGFKCEVYYFFVFSSTRRAIMADQNKPARQEHSNALDGIIPTNPMAAISCYTGIFSILLCPLGPLLGPIAILLGILGLTTWKGNETAYGKTTSNIRAWIGIVTGSIGTILGIVVVISILANM